MRWIVLTRLVETQISLLRASPTGDDRSDSWKVAVPTDECNSPRYSLGGGHEG
jgi:hypothetical protein